MIHVVVGAPCSGKSTYVKEHAGPGDLRVDYDLIALALGAESSHAAEGLVKTAAFYAREGAIRAALEEKDLESWIIHTSPSEEHMKMYEGAGADVIRLDPGYEVCLERARNDERPQQTFDGIEKWYSGRKGREIMVKTKTYEVKADNGTISGYASTWTREPDSYGDVVAKGAFTESIARIQEEGKVLPLLWNHSADDLKAFIGTVHNLEEDEHGLRFDATFDDTEEAQRARALAADGRLAKFSFAYDVLDQATVTLEDGREANELRKLNIHEVSLVMYPANPDTSVVEVKNSAGAVVATATMGTGFITVDPTRALVKVDVTGKANEILEKAGRRNSAKDADAIRQAITLLQGVLGELEDIEEEEEKSDVKSEERGTVNDEERAQIDLLLKEANEILNKGVRNDSE